MVYDGYYEKDHIGAPAAHEYINSLMSPNAFRNLKATTRARQTPKGL
jgi:hypothetical protein